MAQISPEIEDLEISDYFRIFLRRWPWFVLPIALMLGLATLYTSTRAPRFTATAQVLLADSAAQRAIQGESSPWFLDRGLANEINIAQGDQVRDGVTTALGGITPDMRIDQSDNSDLLSFTSTASTSLNAQLFANTWAEVYVSTKQQEAADSIGAATEGLEADLRQLREDRQEVRDPLDQLEDQLANATSETQQVRLENQINRLKSDLEVELELIDARISTIAGNVTRLQLETELARTGTARVVQVAGEPLGSSNAPLSRNLALAGMVGMILGAGLAVLIDNLDRSIKSGDDVNVTGAPLLGIIPKPGREFNSTDIALATMTETATPVADGYQKVRTAVEFALLGRRITSLLITSPNQGEGKTTTSCNLAWAMSAVDHRVVLADVDFRRPRVHEVFGCDNEPGLSDNLLHDTPFNKLALRIDDRRSNMVVIPTGARPPSPGDFVASPAFSELLRNLENEADLVILDAPPVLPVSDALSIARQVDAVIVVAKAGETTQDELEEAIKNLKGVGADVLGVCLVGAKESSSRYGYGKIYGETTPKRGRHRQIEDRGSDRSGDLQRI